MHSSSFCYTPAMIQNAKPDTLVNRKERTILKIVQDTCCDNASCSFTKKDFPYETFSRNYFLGNGSFE